MKHLIAAACVALPTAALAAGGGTVTAPASTETTQVCEDGLVWDDKTETCVAPKESRMTPDQQIETVRELAHAGRYGTAQDMLRLMDQDSDMVQTYWGFTHRKMGNIPAAMEAYEAALVQNPNNILVRSYMGQHFAETGRMDLASLQLVEINTRGGAGTWAATSLFDAIQTGSGASY